MNTEGDAPGVPIQSQADPAPPPPPPPGPPTSSDHEAHAEDDAPSVPTQSQADPAPPPSSDHEPHVVFLRDIRSDIEEIAKRDRGRVSDLQTQKRILFWVNMMVVLIAVVGVGVGLVLWVTKGTELGSISIGLSALLSAALLPLARLWRRLSNDEDVIQARLLERTRFISVVRLAEGMAPHQREKMLAKLAATYTQLIAESSLTKEDTSSNELTECEDVDNEG